MLLTAFLTNGGSPATGLSPTISIWNASSNTLLVDGASMDEIAGGFYKYDYSAYNRSIDYVIRTDGGAGLAGHERYGYSVNESYQEDIAAETWATTVSGYESTTYGEAVALIRQIEVGKWQISGTTLTFYDDDGTTPIASFTLDDPDTPTLRTPV